MHFTSETIVSLTILLLSTPALSAPVPGIGKRDIPEDALKLAHLPRLDDALESPRYIATAPRYVPRSAVPERSIFGAVSDGLTKRILPIWGTPPPFYKLPNTQEDRLPLACAGLNCPGTLNLPAGPPKCQGFGCNIVPTGPIGPFKRNPTETVELPKENRAVEARDAERSIFGAVWNGITKRMPFVSYHAPVWTPPKGDKLPFTCAGINCPGTSKFPDLDLLRSPPCQGIACNSAPTGPIGQISKPYTDKRNPTETVELPKENKAVAARDVATPDTNLDTPGGPIGAKFRLPLASFNNGIICSGAPGVCDGHNKALGGGSMIDAIQNES